MITEEDPLAKRAREFVKNNRKIIIDKLASTEKYAPEKYPVSFFMAGSPGAGKTEFSKEFLGIFSKKNIVRIDADEIRYILPQYNGDNSSIVRGACNLAVEKIHDSVLSNGQSFILDGTFSSFDVSFRDVKRSLDRERRVGIFYVHQEPQHAWEFTKIRKEEEGRIVSKEFFVSSLISSRKNVNQIKAHFGNKVELSLIIKDYKHDYEKVEIDIDNVDSYLGDSYTVDKLNKFLWEN